MALNFSNTVVQRAGVYWEGILTGLFSIDFIKNLVKKCPSNSLTVAANFNRLNKKSFSNCPFHELFGA